MPAERAPGFWPSWRDARWLQLSFQTSFVLYALRSEAFMRAPAQYLAGFAGCVGVDAAILYFAKGLPIFPMSGLISSMGLLLLCDSPRTWPYFFVGALSILSKHLIRVDGRHVFNPTNFGLVCAVLFFPNLVTIDASRWGGTLPIALWVAGLGSISTFRARRLDMGLCYAAAFGAAAWVGHLIVGGPAGLLIDSLSGAEFQLFTFFMITDPRTTPDGKLARCLYGAAIGILDAVLRLFNLRNAPFYSLFVWSAILPILRRLGEEPAPAVETAPAA